MTLKLKKLKYTRVNKAKIPTAVPAHSSNSCGYHKYWQEYEVNFVS
jgi:hypothetical protein